MTKIKLFLRSFLLAAKSTIVSKFPTTIKAAVDAKALHNAIPSALEGKSSVDNDEVLFEDVLVEMFSISSVLTKPGNVNALNTCEDVCRKYGCVMTI